MGSMETNIVLKNLIYFISVLFNLSLGVFVLVKERRKEVGRSFFLSILCACSWLLSLYLFQTIEDPKWLTLIGRVNFATILPMFYFLLRFVFVFPRRTFKVSRKIKTLFRLWIILFTIITLSTPLIGKQEVIVGSHGRSTIYGPLYPIYALHYILFSVGIIGILIQKLKGSKGKTERGQVKYILIGLSLSLLFGFLTNILLYFIGIAGASEYGPLATIIFSGFVTVAILKHYLFDIRVIAAESFTIAFLFVFLASIFLATTPSQKIINSIFFGTGLVLGVFLIRSVTKEVKLRKQSQKMARELQKAYRELKELDKAKSEFIAMASHQLRTPLTIIKGFTSMLLEGIYGKLPAKAIDPIENTLQSSERLVGIVNDLLNISKADLGKLEFSAEEVDLRKMVDGIVGELNPGAEEKGLKLVFKKPEKLDKVKIDRLKTRQVIFNVIDNAIRYTDDGRIEVKIKDTNSKIKIIVKDTGEGLSKEEEKKIFESFTRGRAGIGKWVEGTGLGLYLAKKYMELHNGEIWAESEGRGKGSTFYVEFPKQPESNKLSKSIKGITS